jgi:hypothetical protein
VDGGDRCALPAAPKAQHALVARAAADGVEDV